MFILILFCFFFMSFLDFLRDFFVCCLDLPFVVFHFVFAGFLFNGGGCGLGEGGREEG